MAGLWLGLMAVPVLGATIVSGQVEDATTGSPVPGVTIRVRYGEQLLGTSVSGASGQFQLSFDAGGPEVKNLKLEADHADYIPPQSRLFVVAKGKPDQASFNLELLPRTLSRCVQGEDRHAILVGQFSGEGDDLKGLSERMGEALTYSLQVQLQRLNVRSELLPGFSACWEAELRELGRAGRCARALNAEALVFGRVTHGAARFDVKTFVGDGYGVFATPAVFLNKDVNLKEPDEAVLDVRTHAAILTVIAAAYENRHSYAECVEATVAAERLGHSLTPQLSELRQRCQKATGVGALTRGGSP